MFVDRLLGAHAPQVEGVRPRQDARADAWDAADKMRGNLEAAEYKQIALGLVCSCRSRSSQRSAWCSIELVLEQAEVLAAA